MQYRNLRGSAGGQIITKSAGSGSKSDPVLAKVPDRGCELSGGTKCINCQFSYCLKEEKAFAKPRGL